MAKKKHHAGEVYRDDALFEALGKNKKRKRTKIILTVTAIVLVVAIVAVLGVGALKNRVQEKFGSASGEVLSHQVTTGSISTVVSGSGSLTDVDLESVTVPIGVEVTEVLVKLDQNVTIGDVLATVEMSSVISAMADLQSQIKLLDAQLSDAEDDEADTTIYAGVTGRVKVIYGEKGADVVDVMAEHGALALLSLDGYMEVTIQTNAVAAGDRVKVKLSNGEIVNGTVESVMGAEATVLITDDGTDYEDTVTVLSDDETALGTGTLDIHSALRITGYAGTISEVKAKENKKVTDESKLFILEDTQYSANYQSLLRSRADLEETLLELLTIQRDGAVLAKMDGSVYSLDHTEETPTAVATLSADEKMSVTIDVDEADILSLEVGQTVTVTVSSVSEDSYEGTLTEIDRTGTTSGTYSAVVELDKEAGMLSGMTASVSVQIEGVENAILIPLDALHETRNGAYVYTSYDAELQEYGGKVDVVTGLENSTYVEIKSGLKEGDTVYYTKKSSNNGFGGMGSFGGMGGMSGSSGQMPGFSGEQMPGFNGEQMPDFSGGQMPDFSGGQMPDFGEGRPGGNVGSGRG